MSARFDPRGAAEAFRDRARALGIPASVTFQLTDRCNYRCAHCYETHEQRDELTTVEIKGILDDLAAAGVLFITFTGGEVYMRRDLDEILAHARARRFAARLYTTGHFIDDQRAARLKELALQEVHLSLYGPDAATHEAVTGLPGSFARTVEAARRLRAHGLFVVLKGPLMAVNIHRYAELLELTERLGCVYAMDPKIASREDGERSPLHLRPSLDDLTGFYSLLAGDRAKPPRDHQAPFDFTVENRGAPCRIAESACSINPQGLVFGCVALPVAAGDLRRERFLDVWRSSPKLAQLRRITWDDIAVCRSCALRPFCVRCNAQALLEDGALLGPSTEACRHAVALRESYRQRGFLPEGYSRELPAPLEAEPAPPRQINERLAYGFRPAALRVLG